MPVVELDDVITHLVEEVAVVGYHQQGDVSGLEVVFEPLNHFHIQVVGGLVQNQQVGIGNEGFGQSGLFSLSSRQLVDVLEDIMDAEARENLFGPCFKVPGVQAVHFHDGFLQALLYLVVVVFLLRQHEAGLVFLDGLYGGSLCVEDGVQYRIAVGETVHLRQIRHGDVVADHHLPTVGNIIARNDIQQGALAGTVAGYQCRLLAFLKAEGNLGE